MSGSGGVSIARARGENRFYNPPAMRQRLQQQQQQQHKQNEKSLVSKDVSARVQESAKKVQPEECSSLSARSDCSVSNQGASDSTNLDRFLKHTTPVVPAQYLPKTSTRGWRTREGELPPYFALGDLWESFKEWSAYGAGVPLLLNGSDCVVQYYVPFLSGIQLYVDPPRPSSRLRRHNGCCDADSTKESSSDSSSDYGTERRATYVAQGDWSQKNGVRELKQVLARNRLSDSSSDENEICNSPGQLIFEYLEHDPPFSREPLADKILALSSHFPELRTYRSCDLSPSSWISVAWYPIYRIPTGPTLQNLDACFLTFHFLSTHPQSASNDWLHVPLSRAREVRSGNSTPKMLLPTFGLASYKLKVSFWSSSGVDECQNANYLRQAADNWIRDLSVHHPDYRFFSSHN